MDDRTSDADLLVRAGAGDREAMRVFYERHAEGATRFAHRYTNDAAASADAVHEAMLTVWRDAARFGGRASARTWLFAIVRNKAVDLLRCSMREVASEADETLADFTTNPEEAAELASDARRVRAAMEMLSPNHRAVVHLAFYEEMSYRDIADVLEVPVGTVKTRVHHAKRLLAHLLAAS